MSMFHKTAQDMGIVRKRPAFIRINGRMVRDTSGREVEVKAAKLPSSMVKFAGSYPIGFHKWAPGA